MAEIRKKNFQRLDLGDGERPTAESGEVECTVGQEPAINTLPASEDLTFRTRHDEVQVDRPPMTEKELDVYVKLERKARKRMHRQRGVKRKPRKKRAPKEVRKQRREETQRRTELKHQHREAPRRRKPRRRGLGSLTRKELEQKRKELGLPSRKELRRIHENNEETNRIKRLVDKILGFPNRKRKRNGLASKTGNNCGLNDDKMDVEDREDKGEETEDSDDDEEYNQDSDYGDDTDNEERKEREGYQQMEYDDASGEVREVPRKWGKWFNSVRKDDEGDKEVF